MSFFLQRVNSVNHHLLAILLLLGCCCVAQGAEEPTQSIIDEFHTTVDEFHNTVSDGFSDMIGGVDGFFGDVEGQQQVNRSWMRLRVDALKFENTGVKGRLNAKLKLILPNTEQRVRLLVSTEEEDIRDSSAEEINQQSVAAANDSGNLSLALRFLQSVKERNSVKLDIGARVRDGKAQAFGRVSANSRKDLNPLLKLKASNNLWYFSSSGYDNRLRFDLEKSFADNPDLLARSTTQFTWLEGVKGAGISQTFGVYRAFEPSAFLAFELLGSYRTARRVSEGERFRGAELRLRYRQNIWRPWFYYEVWPQLRWSADEGYRGNFGLLARVEVVVGRRAKK